METQLPRRKKMVGTVISNKMDKTVVVEVEKVLLHPKYKKYVRRKRKYKAHDEFNRCEIGDRVLIVECRPLSKEKRWLVKQILERRREAQEAPIVEEEVISRDTGENEA